MRSPCWRFASKRRASSIWTQPRVAVSPAVIYGAQGRHKQAEPLYRRALAIRETVLGRSIPIPRRASTISPGSISAQGRYAEAEPLYRRALAIHETALGPEHPDTATGLNNLAGLYQAQGRYAEAEPLYRRALAIREKALGAEHPDTAASLNNLAGLYACPGPLRGGRAALPSARWRSARRRWGRSIPTSRRASTISPCSIMPRAATRRPSRSTERALAISEKALGAEHPDTAASLNNLAGAVSCPGPLRGGRAALPARAGDQRDGAGGGASRLPRRASTISPGSIRPRAATGRPSRSTGGRWRSARRRWGRSIPLPRASLNNLAGLYDAQGRYGEAEPLYRRALAICETALGAEHPDTATTLNNLAGFYRAQGRYAEAEPFYRRALAIKETALGAEHPDTLRVKGNLERMLAGERPEET